MLVKLNPGEDFGKPVFRSTVRDLPVVQCVYRRDTKSPIHIHEHSYVGLLLQGALTQTYHRRHFEVAESCFVFHPNSEEHRATIGAQGATLFRVELTAPWLRRFDLNGSEFPEPRCFRHGETASLASRLYRESLSCDELSGISFEGLLLQILTHCGRASGSRRDRKPPVWLRRVIELLHERFASVPSLLEISRVAGVHPGHLARAFRQHCHCSIGDYARRIRIGAARDYLRNTATPLAEIAVITGFCDQSHLATQFKHSTGFTPAEYRRLNRR